MSFGTAKAADLPRLKQLWMDCFGDAEDYVNLYFAHAFVPENVFVLREPEIATMLISFPVRWIAPDGDELPGAYLYAVCTDPARRGKGLCKLLMHQSEQALKARGCAFTCLRAASAGLEAMYRRMGYSSRFTNRELVVSASPEAEPQAVSCQRLTPTQYYNLRQLALQGAFVDYGPEVLAHQGRLGPLLSFNGGEAIAALEQYGETAIFKEYLGPAALLPAIQATLHLKTLTARTPAPADTPGAPFAMAKPLSNLEAPFGYLGLAFD